MQPSLRPHLLRQALRALQTQALPLRISPPPPPHHLPPAPPFPTATATVLLATTTLLTTQALCDAAQPIPTHEWPQILRALRIASTTPPTSPPPFTATRTRQKSAWSFSLSFSVPPQANLHAIQLALTALLPPSATIDVSNTPTVTRITLRAAAPPTTEVSIHVPRVRPFDTRVFVEFTKPFDGPDAPFSQAELDALLSAYRLMRETNPRHEIRDALLDGRHSVDVGPRTRLDPSRGGAAEDDDVRVLQFDPFDDVTEDGLGEHDAAQRARVKLEQLGVEVFDGKGSGLTWDALAGYADVKEQIENTLTLPLRYPDVYESVVRGTRERFESNLPKAVLYEGPPGCGKTLSAKILSASIGVPFVHVPLETILSKYYGETTRKLAEILNTANELGPCLVFIDECDSIGLSRSSSTDIHEVTRRTLSVLLRHIDGLDGPQNAILLAATNHKEDIDPALMSRFDVVVSFPLPDTETRAAVLALYAKHLSVEELRVIAKLSPGFSGRELLDVCEEAERTCAGRLVRETATGNKVEGETKLPSMAEYVDAIERKAPHVVGRGHGTHANERKLAMQPVVVEGGPSVTV